MEIICVSHGLAAEEIKKSVEMIVGNQPNIKCTSFNPGEGPEDLEKRIKDLYEKKENVLFLVDIFGGSPFNVASRLSHGIASSDVITGLSLPLLIDVIDITFSQKDIRADEVFKKLCIQNYNVNFNSLVNNEMEDDLDEDKIM